MTIDLNQRAALTGREAAEALGWPPDTFYYRAKSGLLPFPHYKIGSGIRVTATDVENYLQKTSPELMSA